ncbi:MAG TPA: hypothetical protein VNF04_00710 [Stellaceae bacterium]|nr:hypothetical protein [Stellaceae bacterium]
MSLLARTVATVAATLTVTGLLIGAIGFLSAALYLYLVSVPLPPALASLVVGLALIGVALLVIVAARIAAGRPAARRWLRSAGHDNGNAGWGAAAFGGRVAREAEAATEAHPYGAALFAFLAGLALGGSPELQDIIKTALKATGAQR